MMRSTMKSFKMLQFVRRMSNKPLAPSMENIKWDIYSSNNNPLAPSIENIKPRSGTHSCNSIIDDPTERFHEKIHLLTIDIKQQCESLDEKLTLLNQLDECVEAKEKLEAKIAALLE